jgi:hypothetical protein
MNINILNRYELCTEKEMDFLKLNCAKWRHMWSVRGTALIPHDWPRIGQPNFREAIYRNPSVPRTIKNANSENK